MNGNSVETLYNGSALNVSSFVSDMVDPMLLSFDLKSQVCREMSKYTEKIKDM